MGEFFLMKVLGRTTFSTVVSCLSTSLYGFQGQVLINVPTPMSKLIFCWERVIKMTIYGPRNYIILKLQNILMHSYSKTFEGLKEVDEGGRAPRHLGKCV